MIGDPPPWARCCQGADEVEGLRFVAGLVEMATMPDDPDAVWVMYPEADLTWRWVPCDRCPMCGHAYAQAREEMRRAMPHHPMWEGT